MTRILLTLALLALAGCATTKPEGDVQITIKRARAEQCKAAGGCALVTAEELESLAQSAYQAGAEQAARIAAQSLDSHGCRRGDT